MLSGRCFLAKLADKVVDLLAGTKRGVVAAIDVVYAFLDGSAEPFEPGFVFLVALLQKPQAFAHHFAGVAEAAGIDARFDEAVKVIGQVYVTGRHDGGLPGSNVPGLAIVAN